MGKLAANVVYLDEINAPGLAKLEETVVVFACAILFGVNTIHVGVPLAYAGGFCDLTGCFGSSFDCSIAVNCLARDSAHDMNTEFQSQ